MGLGSLSASCKVVGALVLLELLPVPRESRRFRERGSLAQETKAGCWSIKSAAQAAILSALLLVTRSGVPPFMPFVCAPPQQRTHHPPVCRVTHTHTSHVLLPQPRASSVDVTRASSRWCKEPPLLLWQKSAFTSPPPPHHLQPGDLMGPSSPPQLHCCLHGVPVSTPLPPQHH